MENRLTIREIPNPTNTAAFTVDEFLVRNRIDWDGVGKKEVAGSNSYLRWSRVTARICWPC
jgi:hypothetical protein